MLYDKITNVTLFSQGLNFHLRDSLGRDWQFGRERLYSLGMNRDSVTTVNWRSTAGQDTSPCRVASGAASVVALSRLEDFLAKRPSNAGEHKTYRHQLPTLRLAKLCLSSH